MTNPSLTEEENAVYDLIRSNKRIKMTEISLKKKVGYQEQYEDPQESTPRKVRHIVRSLRIKHHLPIIHDSEGYFIPSTTEEVESYMKQLSARLKSSLITYHTLKNMFGVKDEEVEEQMRLFQLD